jgi:hypothetical protein
MGKSFRKSGSIRFGLLIDARCWDREKKTIPPTLGFVMLICFWRYFALPAISIAIVYGFRNGLPLKAFSHDPVFVSRITV